MLDKTVDKFINGCYIGCDGFSEDISFDDVTAIYKNDTHFDRLLIRQWKDGKEVRSLLISYR